MLKTTPPFRTVRKLICATCLLLAAAAPFAGTSHAEVLVENANLETDNDSNDWPDFWGRPKEGGTWENEDGNRFIRLTSTNPGATTMLYQEVPVPGDTEVIELSWKQRVSNLAVGEKPWFDARIMMSFLDAERNKLTPGPKAPYTRKDTGGWEEKTIYLRVPSGTATLEFMPSLMQVQAGTFDIDDITIRPVTEADIPQEQLDAETARKEKAANKLASRQEKAQAALDTSGTLISNGGFETDGNADSWPDDWGRPKTGGSWEQEGNNHFMRMKSPSPGTMVMGYRTFDLPDNTEALEMTWRQRVTGLKKGEKPWFDARIMMEFLDANGKKLKQKPSPSYTQRDTNGWVDKTKSFLVPEEAVTLVMMPSLFQANAGTFDIDDMTLKPTDPAPLHAAAKRRAEQEKARYVPPETPDESKWPKELKVVGNRLQDTDGKEVWLQGVNAAGLETLPQDKQAIKSTVVAIEDWNSNCIRVPVKEHFWYGQSPYQNDGGKQYRETIDQIITLAANRGTYVAIDLHRFRAPKQEHADFWKDFATKYKDHPAVLFDVFNEPHGISWEVWRNGGYVGNKSGVDESAFLSEEEKRKNQGFQSVGMQGLVDAVRSTGAKNIIIAGGLFWCNDLTGVTRGYALDDKGGNGIMYSWHTYNWHSGWEEKVLDAAKEYPIFLGEVGADPKKMEFVPAEQQEDPATWVPDMLGFIQKHRINWTGWCFHPRSTPRMLLDWDYTPTPFWGAPAKEALAGKQFEMKRMR